MAFWVTVRDGATFVSRARSESGVRTEAEKRGLVIDEITPVSSDTLPAELDKFEQLSVSTFIAFQIACLTAGQISSLLACLGCVPLAISMLGGGGDSANTIEMSFMALIAATLLFFTCASWFIVFSYVKRQLKP